MNTKVHQHLIRYPQARTSTVRYLVAKEEMTDRLRRELQADAQKRLNEFRDDIGYIGWFRRMFGWGR